MLISVGCIVIAYLIGSLSFAVIVSRLMGMADPRSYGSGNPGATNVLRSGRKLAAVLTLLGDGAKGWVAVALVTYVVAVYSLSTFVIATAAVTALLGHMWPVFFAFQGGKGVATALGVLLALNPWLALVAVVTWLTMALVFRISSLAALTASVSAPVTVAVLYGIQHPYFYACLVMTVLIVFRHQANIKKLLTGQESRIGDKTGT